MSRYADRSELRSRLLQEFSVSNHPSLNTDRVHAFMMEKGLRIGEAILVSEEHDESSAVKLWFGELRTQYDPVLDLALLYTGTREIEPNDAVHLEGVLVHELAHASGYRGPRSDRMGFGMHGIDRGWYLEEGFAEHLRGEYVARFRASDQRALLAKYWGVPSLSEHETLPMPREGYVVPLPVCMFYLNGDLGGTTSSALAGIVFDSLIEVNPTIKEQAYMARSSRAGLEEFIRHIEEIESGLYTQLFKTELYRGTEKPQYSIGALESLNIPFVHRVNSSELGHQWENRNSQFKTLPAMHLHASSRPRCASEVRNCSLQSSSST